MQLGPPGHPYAGCVHVAGDTSSRCPYHHPPARHHHESSGVVVMRSPISRARRRLLPDPADQATDSRSPDRLTADQQGLRWLHASQAGTQCDSETGSAVGPCLQRESGQQSPGEVEDRAFHPTRRKAAMERPTALRNRDVFRPRGTRGIPPVAALTTACVGAFPRVWRSTRTGPPRRSTAASSPCGTHRPMITARSTSGWRSAGNAARHRIAITPAHQPEGWFPERACFGSDHRGLFLGPTAPPEVDELDVGVRVVARRPRR